MAALVRMSMNANSIVRGADFVSASASMSRAAIRANVLRAIGLMLIIAPVKVIHEPWKNKLEIQFVFFCFTVNMLLLEVVSKLLQLPLLTYLLQSNA